MLFGRIPLLVTVPRHVDSGDASCGFKHWSTGDVTWMVLMDGVVDLKAIRGRREGVVLRSKMNISSDGQTPLIRFCSRLGMEVLDLMVKLTNYESIT